MAAILTTRGGAFRDLKNLPQAKACANRALKLQPESHYYHNLLGAIYFQSGKPEAGEHHFELAIIYGAKPKEQDSLLRSAIEQSSEKNQRMVAKNLLQQDPKRYRWAEHYLHVQKQPKGNPET